MNQVEVKRRQIQIYAHCLGFITIFLLGRRIGDNGIAYMAAAIECFAVFWAIMGHDVSEVLGRLLRGRRAKGQYKSIAKLKRNAAILQGITGFGISVLLFWGAGLCADYIFKIQYSRLLIMLVAPLFCLRSISGVLLGFFQGEGIELPTAVASVLRQIFILGFGLLFVNLLGKYGEKVSALLGNDAYTSMYGGGGMILAMLLAEVLILLFLLVIYKGKSHSVSAKESDGMKTIEGFGSFAGVLYGNIWRKSLLNLLESLPIWLGLIFYQKNVTDMQLAMENYGLYLGKYLLLCGFVIFPLFAVILPINAKIASGLKKDGQRYVKNIFQSGLHIVVVHALFYTVFYGIMAKQLAGIFCESGSKLMVQLLQSGSTIILFVALAYFFSRLLLLTGKKTPVLICAGIADLVFVVVTIALFGAGQPETLALAYAGVAAALIYAALLGVITLRHLRVGIEWLQVIAIPGGSACVVGLLCILLGKVFTPHLGNLVTTIVCLVLGGMVYWTLLIVLRDFREQELNVIPGGKVIRGIGQMLRVF